MSLFMTIVPKCLHVTSERCKSDAKKYATDTGNFYLPFCQGHDHAVIHDEWITCTHNNCYRWATRKSRLCREHGGEDFLFGQHPVPKCSHEGCTETPSKDHKLGWYPFCYSHRHDGWCFCHCGVWADKGNGMNTITCAKHGGKDFLLGGHPLLTYAMIASRVAPATLQVEPVSHKHQCLWGFNSNRCKAPAHPVEGSNKTLWYPYCRNHTTGANFCRRQQCYRWVREKGQYCLDHGGADFMHGSFERLANAEATKHLKEIQATAVPRPTVIQMAPMPTSPAPVYNPLLAPKTEHDKSETCTGCSELLFDGEVAALQKEGLPLQCCNCMTAAVVEKLAPKCWCGQDTLVNGCRCDRHRSATNPEISKCLVTWCHAPQEENGGQLAVCEDHWATYTKAKIDSFSEWLASLVPPLVSHCWCGSAALKNASRCEQHKKWASRDLVAGDCLVVWCAEKQYDPTHTGAIQHQSSLCESHYNAFIDTPSGLIDWLNTLTPPMGMEQQLDKVKAWYDKNTKPPVAFELNRPEDPNSPYKIRLGYGDSCWMKMCKTERVPSTCFCTKHANGLNGSVYEACAHCMNDHHSKQGHLPLCQRCQPAVLTELQKEWSKPPAFVDGPAEVIVIPEGTAMKAVEVGNFTRCHCASKALPNAKRCEYHRLQAYEDAEDERTLCIVEGCPEEQTRTKYGAARSVCQGHWEQWQAYRRILKDPSDNTLEQWLKTITPGPITPPSVVPIDTPVVAQTEEKPAEPIQCTTLFCPRCGGPLEVKGLTHRAPSIKIVCFCQSAWRAWVTDDDRLFLDELKDPS